MREFLLKKYFYTHFIKMNIYDFWLNENSLKEA